MPCVQPVAPRYLDVVSFDLASTTITVTYTTATVGLPSQMLDVDGTDSPETHPIVVETFTAIVDPKVAEERGERPPPSPKSFAIRPSLERAMLTT